MSRQQEVSVDICPQTLSHINGRPVFQPYNNRDPLLERRNSLKKPPTTITSTSTTTNTKNKINSPSKVKNSATNTPISPKIKSPRKPAIKRVDDSTTTEKCATPKGNAKSTNIVKKSKKSSEGDSRLSFVAVVEVPGSIAAARREQVAIMLVQRKMRTAHYGRINSAKYESKVTPLDSSSASAANCSNTSSPRQDKRCSFITPNSDPVYIAYHDEEWGVPVHDDNLLFELLVLTVAQVGSDWTSVLKKRQGFRDAFSGFDPEIVSKYNEKKINTTSTDYGIELSQVRGVIDNSKRILEMKKELGSFDMYVWGFVGNKAIATEYKACNKIPVKNSKSESMSKDMVKRGFRNVGPSVIHSFMQAAGVTNDHLITCPRHLQCALMPTQTPTAL